MGKGVAVDELDGPFEDGDDAAQETKDDDANHAADAAVLGRRLAGDGAQLAQELDDGDNEAAEGDGAEGVGEGALEGAAGGVLGEVVRAEVPGAVDAGDGGVDGVLEPLGDPVHGEGDEGDEADDAGVAAGGVVVVADRGREGDVDGGEGGGEPGGEGGGDDAAEQADEVDVAVAAADVDARLQHEGGEGDAGDPGVEAEGEEEAEDEEDDAGRVAATVQVVDGGADGPDDVEDARGPDELLGEVAREGHVADGQREGCGQHHDEEQDCLPVEGEAADDGGGGVPVERPGRDADEAGEDDDQLYTTPSARTHYDSAG